MAQDPEGSPAPEGAACAEHPERAARFTCPRCGTFVCPVCWQGEVQRCIRCVRRDPTEAAPKIAWEQPERSLPGRWLATLGSAFAPLRSAPSFAHPDVRAAQRFALVSALPFALLAGIIPHTRTLLFKGGRQIEVLHNAGPGEIALDVLQAGALQLSFNLVELLGLLLPFVTLVRAYAPGRQHAAARALYYRAWLLPGPTLLLFAVYFLLPIESSQAESLRFVFDNLRLIVAPILIIVAMSATARSACGLGPGAAFVVVAVPVTFMLVVQALALLVLLRFIPEAPSAAQ